MLNKRFKLNFWHRSCFLTLIFVDFFSVLHVALIMMASVSELIFAVDPSVVSLILLTQKLAGICTVGKQLILTIIQLDGA